LEYRLGLDPTLPCSSGIIDDYGNPKRDGEIDSDGDGRNNIIEFHDGTDLMDPLDEIPEVVREELGETFNALEDLFAGIKVQSSSAVDVLMEHNLDGTMRVIFTYNPLDSPNAPLGEMPGGSFKLVC